MSESVSESVTRSPIKLFWTAKKTTFTIITGAQRIEVFLVFAAVQMHLSAASWKVTLIKVELKNAIRDGSSTAQSNYLRDRA